MYYAQHPINEALQVSIVMCTCCSSSPALLSRWPVKQEWVIRRPESAQPIPLT